MFLSLALLWLSVCFILFLLKPQRHKNFPPGPFVLPIFGNLLQLSLDNPLKDFERLRKTYGNIYSFYIGSKPAVVISGMKAIKEALVRKGAHFAGRPQDLLINDVNDRKGLIMADYGALWREHRRFVLLTLRNFGLGKTSMEGVIHGEIEYIIKGLDKNIGKSISPKVMFHNAASNIICQLLFGTRYKYNDVFITTIVQCFTKITKMINGPWAMLYDTLPFIHSLPLPFRKVFSNFSTARGLINTLVIEHKKSRIPGDPRDFIDSYLDEQIKRGADSLYSEEQLLVEALDIHLAGTDTTSNTLLTAFLYLSSNPELQARCQREIDLVLEGKALVSFEDRHNMPYVQAVIHEVQRVGNIVPLSVFHATTKDIELMGYTIPKGTMVIENLSSVLNEEGQWKFPDKFHPENFLNEQGEFVKPEAFMPFSAGPRVCLGEVLARTELFLIMVTLLRKFRFEWPEDASEPDFTPVYGVTLTTRPYNMKIQLRGPQ